MPRRLALTVPVLQCIQIPLQLDQWQLPLASHPDGNFVQYLLEGIQAGFHTGFNYVTHSCAPARGNMLSTLDHPEVFAEYLEKELMEG